MLVTIESKISEFICQSKKLSVSEKSFIVKFTVENLKKLNQQANKTNYRIKNVKSVLTMRHNQEKNSGLFMGYAGFLAAAGLGATMLMENWVNEHAKPFNEIVVSTFRTEIIGFACESKMLLFFLF